MLPIKQKFTIECKEGEGKDIRGNGNYLFQNICVGQTISGRSKFKGFHVSTFCFRSFVITIATAF